MGGPLKVQPRVVFKSRFLHLDSPRHKEPLCPNLDVATMIEHEPKQCGKERIYLDYTSWPLSITGVFEGGTQPKQKSGERKWIRDHWGMQFFGFLLISHSYYFFMQPRIICLSVVLQIVTMTFADQVIIMKVPYRLVCRQMRWTYYFLWGSLPFSTTWLELVWSWPKH